MRILLAVLFGTTCTMSYHTIKHDIEISRLIKEAATTKAMRICNWQNPGQICLPKDEVELAKGAM